MCKKIIVMRHVDQEKHLLKEIMGRRQDFWYLAQTEGIKMALIWLNIVDQNVAKGVVQRFFLVYWGKSMQWK